MEPMTRIPTLPQEIILEIFLWLPIMSLMRFRCVSKFFNTLVLDSNFTHVHHLRSMTRDGGTKFLMWKTEDLYAIDLSKEGKISKWNFDHHNQYSYGSCVNGLYCIWKHNKEPVGIFNPSIRKMVLLPYWKKNSYLVKSTYNYSLGYEPIEKKYKVLMQIHNPRRSVRNFIFTLSVDKSWRKIEGIIDFFPCTSMRSCTIKGVIYMMDYSRNSIIAFDIRIEKFKIIGLSNEICKNIYEYDLIEVKGKIALLSDCEYFTGQNDLWILENFEKEEWKSHGIHFPSTPKYGPSQGRLISGSRDGEIILITIENNILVCYFYDVEKNSWRHLEIHGAPIKLGEFYSINVYVETLYLC